MVRRDGKKSGEARFVPVGASPVGKGSYTPRGLMPLLINGLLTKDDGQHIHVKGERWWRS